MEEKEMSGLSIARDSRAGNMPYNGICAVQQDKSPGVCDEKAYCYPAWPDRPRRNIFGTKIALLGTASFVAIVLSVDDG
jgi:hypothetical protein